MFCGKDQDMNSGAMWGWIGGIAGGILGLAGGIVGTYFSIKRTNGPLERSFMIKSATVCWIAILIFLGLLLGLPNPYRFLMWIPYSILLPLGIIFGNWTQQAIRHLAGRSGCTKRGGQQGREGQPCQAQFKGDSVSELFFQGRRVAPKELMWYLVEVKGGAKCKLPFREKIK